MTKKIMSQLALSMMAIFGYGYSYANQPLVDQLSSQLKVTYQIIDNQAGEEGETNCAALGADWASCNRVVVKLANQGKAITDKEWAVYFHSIRRVLRVENEQFKVTQLTGDLHRLEPTDKFTGFAENSTIDIPMINEYWQVSYTDVMPRWYVTAGKAKAK